MGGAVPSNSAAQSHILSDNAFPTYNRIRVDHGSDTTYPQSSPVTDRGQIGNATIEFVEDECLDALGTLRETFQVSGP